MKKWIKPMLVLMPDAQFEDDAEIEREVLGAPRTSWWGASWSPIASLTATGGVPMR